MATLKIEKVGPPLFGFKMERPGGAVSNLVFDGSGTVEASLVLPGLYNLDWLVQGPEGTTFSFKVSLNGAVIKELSGAQISSAQSEVGSVEVRVAA